MTLSHNGCWRRGHCATELLCTEQWNILYCCLQQQLAVWNVLIGSTHTFMLTLPPVLVAVHYGYWCGEKDILFYLSHMRSTGIIYWWGVYVHTVGAIFFENQNEGWNHLQCMNLMVLTVEQLHPLLTITLMSQLMSKFIGKPHLDSEIRI